MERLTSGGKGAELQADLGSDLDAAGLHAAGLSDPPLARVTSTAAFYGQRSHEPLRGLQQWLHFCDKGGNTAAHHAAAAGLPLTARALLAAGASRWVSNCTFDTPASLLDGVPLGAGQRRAAARAAAQGGHSSQHAAASRRSSCGHCC